MLAFAGGLAGDWWLWTSRRSAVQHTTMAFDTTAAPSVAAVVPSSPTGAAARDTTPPLSQPLTPVVPAHPATSPTPAPPPEQDQSADLAQSSPDEQSSEASDDSIMTERRRVAEQRTSDSLVAVRDSQEQAQNQQDETERRETLARLDREAAANVAAQAQLHQAKLAGGKEALNRWLRDLATEVSAGNLSAPVLTAGPPAFIAFIQKRKPQLGYARVLAAVVNEANGEATGEWTVTWRNGFGAPTSRHMKGVATVIFENDAWRLLTWRITEGAP
ncbi:MAG: hypothetical protein ABJC74_05775 [Gemmatimonadota bacterium]